MFIKKFTLIEILLVIGVISFVFALVAPVFRTNYVDSAFIKVYSMIERARQLAITNRENIEAVLSFDLISTDRKFKIFIRRYNETDIFPGTKILDIGENIEFIFNHPSSTNVVNTLNFTSSSDTLCFNFNNSGAVEVKFKDMHILPSRCIFSVRNKINTDNKISFVVNSYTGRLRRKE